MPICRFQKEEMYLASPIERKLLIHVSVWQKPLQYCKVISLQLIKINEKKKKKKVATLLYQQEVGRFTICLLTAQPKKDCHNSASEKPLYLKLSIFSKGLCVLQSLSTFPFPL